MKSLRRKFIYFYLITNIYLLNLIYVDKLSNHKETFTSTLSPSVY